MVTMVLPPPSSKIMQNMMRTWGGIGEKNIGRQLGLARIYSTQRPIKRHDNSLQNSPFWKRAHPSVAFRIIVYLKKEHVNFPFKSTSSCSRDRAPLYDVERSHSPINWSRWKPAAGGDHGVGVFLGVLLMCCSLCCARSDDWLILVVLHCLSVG